MTNNKSSLLGVQPTVREFVFSGGATNGTPINAVAATATIAAADLAIMSNGDAVLFLDGEYTKAASASAEDLEWDDAAALAALIDTENGYSATESTGAVVITSDLKGEQDNGNYIHLIIAAGTTAGGNGTDTSATATITEADVLRVLEHEGATVSFDDNVFTFVETGADAGAGEFGDAAGLIALIDGLTNWGAADSTGDILITAATNSADFNGFEVGIVIEQETAGGVYGTKANGPTVLVDDSYIYVTHEANSRHENKWRRISTGSVY